VRSRGQSASTASVAAAIAISGRRAVGSVAAIAHAIEIVRRELREVEAKEIAELERRDHDGDPGGEARGHRIGNEANETAKPRGAQARRIAPAIHVARRRPPSPKRAAIGSSVTTNAAVGPDTW
jgi:hypothetical protein